MIIIGLIILHFVIGLILATVANIKEHEDDPFALATLWAVWELIVFAFIVLAIGQLIGYIPKLLGKMIKEMRK